MCEGFVEMNLNITLLSHIMLNALEKTVKISYDPFRLVLNKRIFYVRHMGRQIWLVTKGQPARSETLCGISRDVTW
jgi:hypothetical protein